MHAVYGIVHRIRTCSHLSDSSYYDTVGNEVTEFGTRTTPGPKWLPVPTPRPEGVRDCGTCLG